jgi:hypothetical protein
MTNIYLIISLFALGAIIGMYLLALVIQEKKRPTSVAVIHGVFVAAALVLLIFYNTQNPGFFDSIVLFVVAALGGLVLFVKDFTGKPVPRWLALVHAVVAVAGFVVLLVHAFA